MAVLYCVCDLLQQGATVILPDKTCTEAPADWMQPSAHFWHELQLLLMARRSPGIQKRWLLAHPLLPVITRPHVEVHNEKPGLRVFDVDDDWLLDICGELCGIR